MSTRATYEFVDDHSSYTVYKHHDGYPAGAVKSIRAALDHAWPLPRFEADDFGAAFIVANKQCGGGVRLTHSRDFHSDTEHHYTITCRHGVIFVKHEELNRWSEDEPVVREESLGAMWERYHEQTT